MAEMEMTGGKSEEGRDEVETTCDDKSLDLIEHTTTLRYTTTTTTLHKTIQPNKVRNRAQGNG